MLAVVGAVWGAYAGGVALGQRLYLEGPPGERVELASWYEGFAADARAVQRARRASAPAVEDFRRRLGEMQADILRLEAFAGQIVERVAEEGEARDERWDEAYDLRSPPPLGGPEEALEGHENPLRSLVHNALGLSARLRDRQQQLAVFQELVRLQRLDRRTRPEGWPVRAAYISSTFGERIDPFTGRRAVHRGIDFAARPGTEVVAVASGIVIRSGYRDGYGNTVDIDHGNGYVTRYAHNAENLVSPGDIVSRGDPIARVGSTGRATGPHLHFEVLREGEAISPRRYVATD